MTARFNSLLNQAHQLLAEHPHVADELAKCLQLPYREPKDAEGNVCFIDSEEVRPEYRLAFTAADVTYYLVAVLSQAASDTLTRADFHLHFPFPDSAETFWQKAEAGRSKSFH